MIQMVGLEKRYGAVRALDGVTLEVEAGEFFAYLGPNGSGKTTTIRILTGLTRRTAGEAFVAGFHVEKQPIEAKRRCGLVLQTVNLDLDLTVRENLDLYGRLFRIRRRERRARVETMLEKVGMTDRARALVKTLSGGFKRRLLIARALLHHPSVLFLDEPTVGLDPVIRRRIWALLKSIQKDGATVFLTTHYIEEADALAGRVAFLDEGRVAAIDTPQALKARMGRWAVDDLTSEDAPPDFFDSHPEAKKALERRRGSFAVREVNLEDAYRTLTGRRMEAAKDDGNDAAPPSHPGGHA